LKFILYYLTCALIQKGKIEMDKNTTDLFPKYSIKTLVLTLVVLLFSFSVSFASEGESKTAFIGHHIADAHEWHFFSIGDTHVVLPLPIIIYSPDRGLEIFSSSRFVGEDHQSVSYNGYYLDHHNHLRTEDPERKFYDFSITKNVLSMFIGVALMLWVFLTCAARYKKNGIAAPKGVQSFFEPLILFVRDDIAIPNIGKEKYEKFFPFLLTVFFFIWFNNLLGLLPGGANVTGNISVTFVLAAFTFIVTNISGNKNYWIHIFKTPGVPWWLLPIMIPVEVIGMFTKPFSLMVRLFANITAGHIIILSILGLIFIFQSIAVGPVSVIFATFMNFLELLVAFLQAYVFTLLSAIYIGAAVEEHHDHEHHEEEVVNKAAA
jgi:F-type H+-transporting ATPase subunit a